MSPAILVAIFATLAIHVRLGLGHWPEPMRESYDTPALWVNWWVFTVWLLFTLWGAGPLWLWCLFLGRRRPDAWRVFERQALTIFAGCALIVATVAADPYRFVEWFLD
ncbi:MAG: hypothetical protein AAGF92_01365 [Myxococcota bacterium]